MVLLWLHHPFPRLMLHCRGPTVSPVGKVNIQLLQEVGCFWEASLGTASQESLGESARDKEAGQSSQQVGKSQKTASQLAVVLEQRFQPGAVFICRAKLVTHLASKRCQQFCSVLFPSQQGIPAVELILEPWLCSEGSHQATQPRSLDKDAKQLWNTSYSLPGQKQVNSPS